MSLSTIEATAAVLSIPPGTLKRWIKEGCPVARPGRRGRGCKHLLSVDQVRGWMRNTGAQAPVRIPRDVHCHGCGQLKQRRVRAARDAGAYCSRECWDQSLARVSREVCALRRIGRSVRRGVMAQQAEGRRSLLSFVTTLNTKLKLVRRCEDCSSVFLQATHWGPPKNRCAQCADVANRASRKAWGRVAKARRRALERGARADRIDPTKVFERDRWRCHLCGIKTRSDLRGTCEALAPEIDHIVSLAEGGAHTWSNVACACRQCNGEKGAQSIGQLHLNIAA